MKKIINGRKYDTETAKKLAEYSNPIPRNDFGFYEEELYRKKTGEYFIYGWGGAASKYSTYEGNNTYGPGHRIAPISFKKAKEWAERNLEAKEYEKIFGDPETTERKAITIILAEKSIQKIKLKADEENLLISEYIEKIIANI